MEHLRQELRQQRVEAGMREQAMEEESRAMQDKLQQIAESSDGVKIVKDLEEPELRMILRLSRRLYGKVGAACGIFHPFYRTTCDTAGHWAFISHSKVHRHVSQSPTFSPAPSPARFV